MKPKKSNSSKAELKKKVKPYSSHPKKIEIYKSDNTTK